MNKILYMFIYLKKNINKLLVHFYFLLATVGLKLSSSNLSPTFIAILGVMAIQSSVISGYDLVNTSGRKKYRINFIFFSIGSSIFKIEYTNIT